MSNPALSDKCSGRGLFNFISGCYDGQNRTIGHDSIQPDAVFGALQSGADRMHERPLGSTPSENQIAMHLVITIIAVIMVADAAFTLTNLSRVESILHSVFPRMNVKKLALIEGSAGLVIILLKIGTGTVS